MILLRKGKEKDLSVIQQIAHIACPPSYEKTLSREQIEYMLETMYNKGILLEQLLGGYVFLIAEISSKDVGFVSYSVIDAINKVYKLHKLYVLPEFHGKGVGKFLINEVLDKVKAEGGRRLELNIHQENKARDFYESAGFTKKETVNLDLGNGFFITDEVMEKII